MTQPSNEQNFELVAGNIGVLILSESAFPEDLSSRWARALHESGKSVSISTPLPMVAEWNEIREADWDIWLKDSQAILSRLRAHCESIFIAGISMGSTLALRFAELFGSDLAGILIVEPSFPNIRRAHRKIWSSLYEDFKDVDQPIILMYSSRANTSSPANALTIANQISSPFIREVVLEITPNEFPIIADEGRTFIDEVVNGLWLTDIDLDDDTDLIDAEFQSIVERLSLDESSPTTYLDELDRADDEHFVEPNPKLLPIADPWKRNAIIAMILGPIYTLVAAVTDFDPFGIEPWPGILAFLIGLGFFFYTLSDSRSDDDDGAIL